MQTFFFHFYEIYTNVPRTFFSPSFLFLVRTLVSSVTLLEFSLHFGNGWFPLQSDELFRNQVIRP